MTTFEYVGNELELFSQCTHWKNYAYSQFRKYLGSEVAEVGAGIGTNTAIFCEPGSKRWVCIEPDAGQAAEIQSRQQQGLIPPVCEVRVGTSATAINSGEKFDTAIYIDVLEHIENDGEEVGRIASHLQVGGRLIALGPAHNFLFSPFDASVGHFRRYDAKAIRALPASGMRLISLRYLDSVGMCASLANRLLLSQKMPTAGQLAFWDRFLVPLSTFIDPVLRYRCGKSILAVWQKL